MDEKNKRAFGQYLSEKIKDSGLRKTEVVNKIRISLPYLIDIEKGNRKAPLKHLKKLEELLNLNDEERNTFYDLAYQTHGNHPDINEYLSTHPYARLAIRLARDKKLSGEEFLELVLSLDKDNKNNINNEEEFEK